MLQVIEPKQFTSLSTEYGKRLESTALEKYIEQQHQDITVCSAGFVIFADKPYLGATLDAYIHDPRRQEQYGLKCPYKYRNLTPEDACLNGDFCSTLSTSRQLNSVEAEPSILFTNPRATGNYWQKMVRFRNSHKAWNLCGNNFLQ